MFAHPLAAVDANPFLVFSCILWTVAAVLSWRAALSSHRLSDVRPRVVAAVAVSSLAVTYLIQIFGEVHAAVNMRRACGWILAVGIAWTAAAGVAASRRQQTEQQRALQDLLAQIRSDRTIG